MLIGLIFALATADADMIHDALDQPPAAPWQWLREDRGNWRIEDKHLQIAAQRGTLWTNKRNDAKNILLRPWPADVKDADITVTIRFAPEQGGEQAGVMLYFGDDDYVKIVREFLDGKRWIVMGREQAGEPKQIATQEEDHD